MTCQIAVSILVLVEWPLKEYRDPGIPEGLLRGFNPCSGGMASERMAYIRTQETPTVSILVLVEWPLKGNPATS